MLVRDRAASGDIPALNRLFSDAFTDRYRRDGMTSMRVPHLSPAVWRFAIERAGDGAMIWRDARGAIAAFNMVHLSGIEGWMGPLAVRLDHQGMGVGRRVVSEGIGHLRAAGAATIGIETMPRTIDNIGFYSRLGFVPGALTISMAGGASRSERTGTVRLGELQSGARELMLERCLRFCSALFPGITFQREMELTLAQGLGDVTVLERGGGIEGFVLWHHAPLAEGREAEEVRVLKLVAADVSRVMTLLESVSDAAARMRLARVVVRCQTAERELYRRLAAAGWQVLWTDLRLTLSGYDERPGSGVLLSNWEI